MIVMMPICLILIKLQGKKPNMEPNEPFLSFEEKRENKLKKKESVKGIGVQEQQKKRVEKKRTNENLDHLSVEQKKERYRANAKASRIKNKELNNERRRADYALNKQAEGKIYKPHKRYEQTSQPVEQASQLVEETSIQTPIYNSG